MSSTATILIITLIGMILCILLNRREFAKEEALLQSFGFTRQKAVLRFDNTRIRIPSRKLLNFGHYRNPIRSDKNPKLLIFKWIIPGEPSSITRVFAYRAEVEKKFAEFILKPKGKFIKFKKDNINYPQHQDFSKKYFLTAQGNQDNLKRVIDFFDNPSLHKALLTLKDITIESNGTEIFYYWQNKCIAVEKFTEKITQIEKLHEGFFDMET